MPAMLTKCICFLLLITAGLKSYEQSPAPAAPAFDYKRDFKGMLEKSQESGSELSYQKLLIRFLDRDTTLSNYQVLMLMIGYTEDSHYKPFDDMQAEQEVFDLNEAGNYEDALVKGKPYLQTHPLSLRVNQEVSFCYHSLKKEDSATYYMDLVDKIMAAMIYSGKGKKPEEPIFSLGLADGEYFIPNIGLKVLTKDTDWNKNNQFIEIVDASKDVDDHTLYYFIIQHAKDKIDDDKVNDASDKKGKKGDKKGKWDKKGKDKKNTQAKPVDGGG